MRRFVIDASVAVKWVVTETGTSDALALMRSSQLAAPDLLMAECANVLWKKVQKGGLGPDEALMAARILQRADIDVYSSRQFLDEATRLAIELDHPAYDCVYLALAVSNGWGLVSADSRFIRKLRAVDPSRFRKAAMTLEEAVAQTGR